MVSNERSEVPSNQRSSWAPQLCIPAELQNSEVNPTTSKDSFFQTELHSLFQTELNSFFQTELKSLIQTDLI